MAGTIIDILASVEPNNIESILIMGHWQKQTVDELRSLFVKSVFTFNAPPHARVRAHTRDSDLLGSVSHSPELVCISKSNEDSLDSLIRMGPKFNCTRFVAIMHHHSDTLDDIDDWLHLQGFILREIIGNESVLVASLYVRTMPPGTQ